MKSLTLPLNLPSLTWSASAPIRSINPTRIRIQCTSRYDATSASAQESMARHDWQSACAILASQDGGGDTRPSLDLRPLTIADLSPTPTHGSRLRVAHHGVPGAYSEAAARKAYPECEAIPCDQFEVAFQAVELWIADRAVLPVENSLGGSIHRNYDLLLRHRLHIVGEVQLHVLPGVAKENLISHPQALSADGIQDEPSNVTRFVMLAREPVIPRTDRPFKTSIVFAHEGGASVLFKVLSAFAFRGIRLAKIESRPHRNRPVRVHFEYVFYLDFEASMAEERAQNALAEVHEFTSFLRVLGSYPMDMTPWKPNSLHSSH